MLQQNHKGTVTTMGVAADHPLRDRDFPWRSARSTSIVQCSAVDCMSVPHLLHLAPLICRYAPAASRKGYDLDLVTAWAYGGGAYEVWRGNASLTSRGVSWGGNNVDDTAVNNEAITWSSGSSPDPTQYHVCVRWYAAVRYFLLNVRRGWPGGRVAGRLLLDAGTGLGVVTVRFGRLLIDM